MAGPLEVGLGDVELLARVVGFYADTLTGSSEALGWLQARGLGDGGLVGRFRVGFSNRTLGYRLPERNRKEGAVLRARLQALGVLRSSGHEHFRGAVTVPMLDEGGAVVQVYGHRVGRARQDRNPQVTEELWLPGDGWGVWNPEALTGGGEVIVAGSVLDGLSLWAAGFRHVTVAWGPGGFGDGHAELFARYGVARVLIAFARPDGDGAATAVAEQLTRVGVECFRVLLPRGATVNDVTAEAAAPTEVLGRLVRAASWMGTGPSPHGRGNRTPEPERCSAAPPHADPPCMVEPGTVAPGTENPHAENAVVAEPPAEPGVVVSPVPALVVGPEVVVADGELRLVVGDRRWRVRGLEAVSSLDRLRVNVLVARTDAALGELFHVDTLDLYSARARAGFVHAAAGELRVAVEVLRRDVGRLMLACETEATDIVRVAHTPTSAATVVLDDQERAAAFDLLGDPDLLGRVVADVGQAGFVGEATNVLVAFLAAVSRKLDSPLAVLVQSMSAAGKSSLVDAVLALVPAEDRVVLSAMTGQSLFYMGETDLAHRVLAVAEEEGAARAWYALKVLQSDGELSIASTGKEAASGRLTTRTYRVAGPVALFLTTTAAVVDEELANRCLVLAVDEDRGQTRAIHAAQRQAHTLTGVLAEAERRRIVKVHQDAQRLLESVLVVNPYAPQLGFADERTRSRRDHAKYLNLIRAVALVHQHQRPRRTALTPLGEEVVYIEVTPADIAVANRLAHDVLGRSLDELAPQTRRLLELIVKLVGERCAAEGVGRPDVRFCRREVRGFCGWSDFQVRTHLGRLVELEYVLVHRGGRGQSFVYELLYDGGGTDGGPHLCGLVDPATLTPCGYDTDRAAATAPIEPPTSTQRAPGEDGSRVPGNGRPPASTDAGGASGPAGRGTGGAGSGVIPAGDG